MIGLFDSGVGGLSVLREILKILPGQDYVYYADNANCPYGEKTREFIIDRAREITDTLIGKGAEVVVVACNTATAAAISTLRKEYGIPFIGMEPAVKPAVHNTKTGVVGVLATAGTLRAQKYIDTREKFAENVKVVEHVGKGFVELVESGRTEGAEAEDTVAASLKPLLDEGADTIVLGCTHYPFLSDCIRKVAVELCPGREIEIIDPAPAVARHLLEIMDARGISRSATSLKDSSGAVPNVLLMASGDMTVLRGMFGSII
ncbi:MAG: glutamate racemase [Candidatus Cryptobacteroides sp.]